MSEHNEINLSESYDKLDEFLNKNKQPLGIAGIVLAVLIGGYYYYAYIRMPAKEKDAQAQIYIGQNYFESDSIGRALNGDGNYLGFLSIIDEYSGTKAGNLANYYAGISYLKMGNYQDAVKYLEEFSSDDIVVSAIAFGAIGDAYTEMNDWENGLKYYQKAMKKNPNEFSTPIFMMKTALVLEKQEKFSEAREIYEQIKNKYPLSPEAKDIDKYIARAEAKM